MTRSRHTSKPLADLVSPALGPALAAQGFTGADIVQSWPEIVGERLAAASRPMRVEWPRRRNGVHEAEREPATLVVRVEGAFALEFQHLAPVLLERVNAVYGWRCVGRIVLKQGPVRSTKPASATVRPVDPVVRRRVTDRVGPVGSEELHDALMRLGCAVLGSAEPSATSSGTRSPQSS